MKWILLIILVVLLTSAIVYTIPNQTGYRIKTESYTGRAPFRVVISFSTTPQRVKYTPEVVARLAGQTYLPDEIYANIPYVQKRKNKPYDLGDLNFVGCKVLRCEDYGPATKLLGCVDQEPDPSTLIITIDDDRDYDNTLVERCVTYAVKYPNACFSVSALTPELGWVDCEKGLEFIYPEIAFLEGWAGVGYRRKFITAEMMKYYSSLSVTHGCFVSDDLTLSTWVRMAGADIVKVCPFENWFAYEIDEVHYTMPLYQESRVEVYNECKLDLERVEFYRELVWCKSFNYLADHREAFNTEIESEFDPRRYQNIADGSIVCMRTYHVPDFLRTFRGSKSKIILITTESDQKTSDLDFFELLMRDKRILHWYCQNAEVENAKITCIPVGMSYQMHTEEFHPFQQEQILKGLVDVKKEFRVLCDFHHNDTAYHSSEPRATVRDQLQGNSLVYFTPERVSVEEYWKTLARFAFVVSPRGNGLDCHRTWEAMAVGTIPIVKSSGIDQLYRDLPVVIVDDWSEITAPNLRAWKMWVNTSIFNMSKLRMDYWKTLIRGNLN
jgi:hypothetical protein